eukprot:475534_1
MAVYNYRNKLKLPDAHGLKVLETDSNSVLIRWTFLSTHSLSIQQLEKLTFELKTMDNSLNGECTFDKTTLQKCDYKEYKAKLNGLKSDVKYKLMIRCKLKYNNEILYSVWSNCVEFSTKQNKFIIITNQKHLEKELLLHKLNEYKNKCNELEIKNKELMLKLNKLSPAHSAWNYIKIVEWIMRIQNGIFKPYKQILLTNLQRESINGKSLCQLQISDLHRLGITKFAHKKILMSHIHKLTENDILPEYQYDHQLAKPILSNNNTNNSNINDRNYNEEKEEFMSPTTQIPINDTHFAPPSPINNNSNNSNNNNNNNNDVPKFNIDNNKSNSYGLTKSAKNLLVSNPSEQPPKKWKYKNGVLSIKVIKATNVDNMDEDEGPDSASDPYVQLELKGHYKTEKTKVIQNNANPVWNERFQLFPDNPKKDVLKLKIWDKDLWTFDDKIGSVYIPVIDVLNANGYINKSYDIKDSKCGAKLYLELRYKELQH